MENIIILVFLFYTLIFLLISTFITWLWSKKYPSIWLLNKCAVVFYIFISISFVVSVYAKNYFDSLPSGQFKRGIGFPLSAEINNLQAITVRNGDNEQINLLFSTNDRKVKQILGACFYEISEEEALIYMPDSSEYLNKFMKNPQTHYFEKPAHDVEETHCLGDFTDSFVAYNAETGEVYFQRNWHGL